MAQMNRMTEEFAKWLRGIVEDASAQQRPMPGKLEFGADALGYARVTFSVAEDEVSDTGDVVGQVIHEVCVRSFYVPVPRR